MRLKYFGFGRIFSARLSFEFETGYSPGCNTNNTMKNCSKEFSYRPTLNPSPQVLHAFNYV